MNPRAANKVSVVTLISPALLVLVSIIVYPVIFAIAMSFSQIDLGSFSLRLKGLSNFIKLFTDPQFWHTTLNSLMWIVGCTAGSFLLGFILALLLNRKIPGIKIFRLILLIPWTVPGVVIAYNWFWLYHPDFGMISWAFEQITGSVFNFLANKQTALPSIMLVNIWWGYPFDMLMLLAGLQTLPSSNYDAALIDGATPLQVLRYIIIPWLSPVITIVIILETIRTLNGFTLVKIMTGGGPGGATDIFAMLIYRKGFMFFHFEEAAAAGIIVLVISLMIAMLYLRIIMGRRENNV